MSNQKSLRERIIERARKKIPNTLEFSNRADSNRDIRKRLLKHAYKKQKQFYDS